MHRSGQAIIILLLIMLVALTVGLAITQRSLTNISNSSKEEQSSRAFSAAESGIEQALYSGNLASIQNIGNAASVNVISSPPLPATNQALEYPPIGKETTAQVWLADPNSDFKNFNIICSAGSVNYCSTSFDVYFGNYSSTTVYSDPNTPAIEVTLVTKDASNNYNSTKYFFDPLVSSRNNGFSDPGCSASHPSNINTSNSSDTTTADRSFRCKANITYGGTDTPILLRIRILYSSTAQALAVQPLVAKSLPPQAVIFTSTGTSGAVQRKIQLFKMQYVVPFYFDYSIFSAGNLAK